MPEGEVMPDDQMPTKEQLAELDQHDRPDPSEDEKEEKEDN